MVEGVHSTFHNPTSIVKTLQCDNTSKFSSAPLSACQKAPSEDNAVIANIYKAHVQSTAYLAKERLAGFCRFFCGPNAKKSDALAKQQKKRPRAQDMAEQESEESESSTSDDDDEAAKKKPKKAASSKILSKKEAASGKKKPASGRSLCTGSI